MYFLVLNVIKKETRKIFFSFSIKIKLILDLAPSIDRFGCFSWNRPDHYAYAYHLCIFIVFYFFMEDSNALPGTTLVRTLTSPDFDHGRIDRSGISRGEACSLIVTSSSFESDRLGNAAIE